MTQLNTLLAVIISTILLTSVANAKTIEIVKATPINHQELHAALKLQLQEAMISPEVVISAKDIPLNAWLIKDGQQEVAKTVSIAKIDYSAE